MADADPGPAAADTEASDAALVEVVKGLRDEKELLFGIGAGIVLIGVLTATTSIAMAAIVAVVLMAALGAWMFGATRRVRDERGSGAAVRRRTRLRDARISGGAEVDNYDDESGTAVVSTDLDATGATISGSRVGNTTIGPRRDRD